MRPPEAAIIGGSIGGVTAAIALTRAGFSVHVYERSPRPLQGQGAGIVLHPETVREIGTSYRCISTRATSVRYLDPVGMIAASLGCSFRLVSYSALHRALLDKLEADRYHLAHQVTEFAEDADRLSVTFADGTTATADVLVCADGVKSAAREQLLPGSHPRYAGYVGWRGTVPESALEPNERELFADALSYCVLPNSHIVLYPIVPLGNAGRREALINWVWYRNIKGGADLARVLSDRDGRGHEVSVGAGKVPEATVLDLRETARATLPPPAAKVVAATRHPFVQAVVDVESSRMAFGRICLIGDAAFALRPHIAAGTAKAAGDARALGEALAGCGAPEVPAALAGWQKDRLVVGQGAIARTRDVGERLQFANTWRIGDPLPYGLSVHGDSRMD